MIQVGSIVKLASKWSRPKERHLLYGIKEMYEDEDRCKIMCLDDGDFFFKSIEVVDFEMIEDTGFYLKRSFYNKNKNLQF